MSACPHQSACLSMFLITYLLTRCCHCRSCGKDKGDRNIAESYDRSLSVKLFAVMFHLLFLNVVPSSLYMYLCMSVPPYVSLHSYAFNINIDSDSV